MSLEIIPSVIRSCKAYQYAIDVTEGRIVSGKKRIQACQRFLDEKFHRIFKGSRLRWVCWRFLDE